MSTQTTLSGWLSNAKTLDSKRESGVNKENLGGGEYGEEGGRRQKECWETWEFRFSDRPTRGREGELVTATYNICGGAESKTEDLFSLMQDQEIDILAIQETKCKGKKAYWGWKKMAEANMMTVWADARGTSGGVGLVMGEKWARHVLHTDTYQNRIVSVTLGFRHTKIRVVCVYWPASNSAEDRKAKRDCTKWIRDMCQRDGDKNIPSIWMGDWNSIIDASRDGTQASEKHDKWGVEVMEANGMVDTFRIAHPNKVMVSYLRKEARSKGGNILSGARLDGIWVSAKLAERVAACDINIACHHIDESDHVPVLAAFDQTDLCTPAKAVRSPQRKVPHWQTSTEEQRKAYELKAISMLKRLNAKIAEARTRWMEDWKTPTPEADIQEEATKAACTPPNACEQNGS